METSKSKPNASGGLVQPDGVCRPVSRPNRLVETDTELASFSLTLLPNGESGQWQNE
jgi:hypothetical protein